MESEAETAASRSTAANTNNVRFAFKVWENICRFHSLENEVFLPSM